MLGNILCTLDSSALDDVLQKVFQTCTEMVEDRGFSIVESRNPSSTSVSGSAVVPVIVAQRQGMTLWVVFHTDDKIGVRTIRQLLDEMEAADVGTTLLVSKEGPTPFSKRELGPESNIQCFQYKQLVFNISRCAICPQHTLLDDTELATLRQTYDLKSIASLPRLYLSDPICRYFDFPKGGVVSISRTFGGNRSMYYRAVS